MHTLRRQLRIWRHEFSQMWGKIPFYGRLIIGAALSAWIATSVIDAHLKPLNKSLGELQKGLEVPENLDIEKDEEIIMNNDRADRLQSSIAAWQKRVDTIKSHAEVLNSKNHLTILEDIQSTLSGCSNMRLVYERIYDPAKEAAAAKAARKTVVPFVVPNPRNAALGVWHHQYRVQGTFRQIQAFFGLLEMMDWRFELSNIKLVVNPNANAIDVDFILSIYYLKD